jgi:lactoylglutathione lyase
MIVAGLHHAGVHVSNLDGSARFYQAVFGFSIAERLRLGSEQLMFLRSAGARLELIADGRRDRQNGAIDHIAFEVEDLDIWLSRLRQHGVRLLDEAPVEAPQLKARILFCLGPDGERIELFEQRSTCAQRAIAQPIDMTCSQ